MAKTSIKRKKINFQLENQAGRTIYVAGSFNDWAVDPSDKKAKVKQLKEKENGKYSVSMFLTPGEYEYKFFTAEGEWLTDPNAEIHKQNQFGTFNSVIRVG